MSHVGGLQRDLYLSVWPELAKFRHFGNILKALVKFVLVFGNILNKLWQLFYASGSILTDVNGQMLIK